MTIRDDRSPINATAEDPVRTASCLLAFTARLVA
jgi:hypothetical protein